MGSRVLSCVVGVAVVGVALTGCGKTAEPVLDLGTAPATASVSPTPSVTSSPAASTTSGERQARVTPPGWKPAESPEDKEIFEVAQKETNALYEASRDPENFKKIYKPYVSNEVLQLAYDNAEKKYFSKGLKPVGDMVVYSWVVQREVKYVILQSCLDSSAMRIVDASGKAVSKGALEPTKIESAYEKMDGRWVFMGAESKKSLQCGW